MSRSWQSYLESMMRYKRTGDQRQAPSWHLGSSQSGLAKRVLPSRRHYLPSRSWSSDHSLQIQVFVDSDYLERLEGWLNWQEPEPGTKTRHSHRLHEHWNYLYSTFRRLIVNYWEYTTIRVYRCMSIRWFCRLTSRRPTTSRIHEEPTRCHSLPMVIKVQ